MVRLIASVLIGYVVMALAIFILFTGSYIVMGTEGAFQPASYEVSPMWIFVSIVVGLLAGIAGGFVCASVAPHTKAPVFLIVLVAVLGTAMAIPMLSQEAPEIAPVRAGEVKVFDAMNDATQPTWMAFINPLLGVVGVAVGARARSRANA